MNTKHAIVAAAAMLGLSACASTHNMDGALDPEAFGEANRQTYAAMVVNPEPVYTEEMTASADKAADAVKRYNDDAVKQPDPVSSSSGPNS